MLWCLLCVGSAFSLLLLCVVKVGSDACRAFDEQCESAEGSEE